MTATQDHTQDQTQDKAQAAFDTFVELWTTGTTAGRRAPVLRRPDEVGLAYEDVTFPSMDGVPLEGWFIPAEGSDRLVIHDHCPGPKATDPPTCETPAQHHAPGTRPTR